MLHIALVNVDTAGGHPNVRVIDVIQRHDPAIVAEHDKDFTLAVAALLTAHSWLQGGRWSWCG